MCSILFYLQFFINLISGSECEFEQKIDTGLKRNHTFIFKKGGSITGVVRNR